LHKPQKKIGSREKGGVWCGCGGEKSGKAAAWFRVIHHEEINNQYIMSGIQK